MTIFEYLKNNTPSFLVGRFTNNSYQQQVYDCKKVFANYANHCLENYKSGSISSEIKQTMSFYLDMIHNHRFESWEYPIFCLNVDTTYKGNHQFHITKGFNKLLANFLARRPVSDIPVVVINYGSLCDKIQIEKKIESKQDFDHWTGQDIDLSWTFREIDGHCYPTIELLEEKHVKKRFDNLYRWLNIVDLYLCNGKIPIKIADQCCSEIFDSSEIFDIQQINDCPGTIERSTHIREYKNLLKNQEKSITSWTLVTNRRIKLDLFDIVWFLQDHASDYVSEDRSYSILGPGAFRADSVLPGSEL